MGKVLSRPKAMGGIPHSVRLALGVLTLQYSRNPATIHWYFCYLAYLPGSGVGTGSGFLGMRSSRMAA